MDGLEHIAGILSELGEDMRLTRARQKLKDLNRLKSSIEAFTEMEIAMMFNLSMKKRSAAINTLTRLIIEQEKHIVWLHHPRNKLNSTSDQDASIDKMYEAQRADAERLGMLPFTND